MLVFRGSTLFLSVPQICWSCDLRSSKLFRVVAWKVPFRGKSWPKFGPWRKHPSCRRRSFRFSPVSGGSKMNETLSPTPSSKKQASGKIMWDWINQNLSHTPNLAFEQTNKISRVGGPRRRPTPGGFPRLNPWFKPWKTLRRSRWTSRGWPANEMDLQGAEPFAPWGGGSLGVNVVSFSETA